MKPTKYIYLYVVQRPKLDRQGWEDIMAMPRTHPQAMQTLSRIGAFCAAKGGEKGTYRIISRRELRNGGQP